MKLFAQAIKELIHLGVKGAALEAAIDRLTVAADAGARTVPEAVELSADIEDAKLPEYDPREARRRLDRERKRKKAENSGKIPQESGTEERNSAEPAENSLPLPPSPQTPQPPTPTREGISSRAREGPPSSRGTRLPDDWEPSELDRAFAKQNGLTDDETDRLGLDFRNYWTSRGDRGAAKLNWHRTWQNRVLEQVPRILRDRQRLAPRPIQSASGGRGSASFADIIARRRGFVED